MSYQNGTTHYNLPQTVGSDKRDWFDTNEAFREIDEAIHTAVTNSSTALSQIEEVSSDVSSVDTKADGIADRVTTIEGKQATDEENITINSSAINGLQTEVRDNKQDLKDSICSIEEQSATAQYRHEVGTYFWYNDTLYKTTVLIAVNQQIVPNVNCDTTNITTELLNGGSGDEVTAVDVSLAPITGMTATEVQSGISELNGFFGTLMFRVESGTGNAQYSKDGGTTWVNFKNPVGTKSITANGTYDVTDYASASVNVSASSIVQTQTLKGNERNKSITLNHRTNAIYFCSSYGFNTAVMTIAVNGTVLSTPSATVIQTDVSPNYGLYVYRFDGNYSVGDVITLNSTQSANTMGSFVIA